MPECDQIVEMLSDYLDRDLPPETCEMIQRHLESCPNCAGAAESLRATVSLCRQFRSDARPGPIPPECHRELKDALQKVLSGMRSR